MSLIEFLCFKTKYKEKYKIGLKMVLESFKKTILKMFN